VSVDNPLRTGIANPGDPDNLDPADELPPAGAAALPIPTRAGDALAGRRLPFAARFQAILIGVMFVGFALIAQGWSKTLYQIGLPLLVLAAFLQIAFGNIPPSANLARSLRLLAVTWVIVAAVFGLGIVLAPYLIELGR